jgi:calcineurin-like phosphoesterase family protein
MAEAHVDGERVTLCHYGMRVWPASHHGAWHFFGHSHGRLPNHGRSRDVGVDCVDVAFTPRTFRQLTAGMSLEIAA